MKLESPHISTPPESEKRPITNSESKFSRFFIRKSALGIFNSWFVFCQSVVLSVRNTILYPLSSILLVLATGCGITRSASIKPVIVNVTDAPQTNGRFRAPERQRDVWIAPQASDNDTLLHEQTVTFVERPQAWQLLSSIEPHTISPPDLPLQEGDYDAEVLRRQREMIQDKQKEISKITTELENLKHQTQQALDGKEKQSKDSDQKLREVKGDLTATLQKLKTIEETDKLKQEQEEEKRKQKHWWRFW